MTATAMSSPRHRPEGFRHEAMFYEGDQGFLAGAVPFIREGLVGGEEVLVVVSDRKIDLLRANLDKQASRVRFADMAEVGSNPARIIPAWRDFVDANTSGDRPVRGIGEPIWAGRRPVEMVECQLHESLLNLEFADDSPLWLLCPYDTESLGRSVIEEARRSHPHLRHGQIERASSSYRGEEVFGQILDGPLPEPDDPPEEMGFGTDGLDGLRRFVCHLATDAGIPAGKTVDLVLAANEVVTNSVVHGGGQGTLRAWTSTEGVVCEVRDSGRIDRPLIGRERPGADMEGGRGIWLANQLCDLVQVRSCDTGTVVRLHAWRA